VEVTFAGVRNIDRVVVFSLQDDPAAPVEPGDALRFANFGASSFSVEGWNGSAWVVLATVTGNDLVKRTVRFAAMATDRIRVSILATPSNHSRLVEIEAWTATAATRANFALVSAGATASASSTGGAEFGVGSLVDGDRLGVGWGSGGGWKDATANAYPDWVQIDFSAGRTIDEVVVYSLQDSPASPVEPGDGMTFASFGAVDFTVEGWTGSAWVTLASVTGNNLVKRPVQFAPFATARLRVNVLATPSNHSRLVEIEAWGS
jgi:hypothetical protein